MELVLAAGPLAEAALAAREPAPLAPQVVAVVEGAPARVPVLVQAPVLLALARVPESPATRR